MSVCITRRQTCAWNHTPGGKQHDQKSHGKKGAAKAIEKGKETLEKAKEDTRKGLVPWVELYQQEAVDKTEDPYRPDIENDANGDGIPDFSKVGVPAMLEPPPPSIPRMPNLTPEERAHESAFADAYEENPQAMIDAMRTKMANGELGDAPNIFATDEAKMLYPAYAEDLEKRSTLNIPLHQTANAIAKKAFIDHLDQVVMKLPEDQRTVLVTAGGVAAGKGFALENNEKVSAIAKKVAAVWDSAGEQNSTELPWVMEHLEKRGIKGTFVYVHADPSLKWENPKFGAVRRAAGGKNPDGSVTPPKGRMVDANLYADSYSYGAANFEKFWNKHDGNDNHKFMVVDTTKQVKDGDKIKLPVVDTMPKEATQVDRNAIYRRSLKYLLNSGVPDWIKRGGSLGIRIWDRPVEGT